MPRPKRADCSGALLHSSRPNLSEDRWDSVKGMMMDNTGASPSVRSHLAAGGAVAGAGILALGLVAAPPDTNGARVDALAVHLAAFALPPVAHSSALPGKVIVNQAKAVIPVIPTVVHGGAADVGATGVKTPVTFDSAIDPAINSQQVNNAALAATTPGFDWNRDVLPILGPIILFGGIAIGLFVVAPLIYVYDLIAGVLGLPTFTEWQLGQAGASMATADVQPTIATSLTNDPPLLQSATLSAAKEATPAIETGDADVSPPVASAGPTDANDHKSADTEASTTTAVAPKDLTDTTKADEPSTEPATGNEVTSTGTTATKDLTESVKADEPSTEPTSVDAPKSSAGAYLPADRRRHGAAGQPALRRARPDRARACDRHQDGAR